MRRRSHVDAWLDDRLAGGELIPEDAWPGGGGLGGVTEEDDNEEKEGNRPADESKREFLKVAATISTALALAGIASVMKAVIIPAVPGSGSNSAPTFPKVKVSSLAELAAGKAVIFNYPLDDEPNILVKLGRKATGGVGPDGDIVAFSQVCQHLGCIYGFVPAGSSPPCKSSYVASTPVGYCCCHGSVYDFADGAKVIAGPSPSAQPQVTLEVDSSGDVFAVGMGPPTIFGHNTGSNDVTADLQGGNLV
jgi:arsenite oxidase small subunit